MTNGILGRSLFFGEVVGVDAFNFVTGFEGYAEAVVDQAVFECADLPATIVGFWSPGFSQAIAIPGYHLHAISDDRAQAGHVFDLRAQHLTVDVHRVSDLHVALPETEAFLQANLVASHADMDAIERSKG